MTDSVQAANAALGAIPCSFWDCCGTAARRAVQTACRSCKSPRPSDFQSEADVCDNCNQVFSITITPPLWSP